MATLYPFRALRPDAPTAARIAAVPYDVVNTDEARALADGNPLSFLRVSRAEIELPAGTDPYADAVYQRAADNFATLATASLVVEDEPSVYFYRLQMGGHVQTGLAACFSIDEYDRDIIKKHERTRRDKEDDRTRHMLALGAQTGPVFLTYRARGRDRSRRRARRPAATPLFDFTAPDGVRHTLWRVGGADRDALVAACRPHSGAVHRRRPSSRRERGARARRDARARLPGTSLGDGADASTMLAVAFPHDQVQILAVQPHREGPRRSVARRSSWPRCASASRSRAGPADAGAARRHRDVLPGRVAHAAAARRAGSRAIRSARSTSACCRSGCSRRS